MGNSWKNNNKLKESEGYLTREELADRLGLDYDICKKVEETETDQSFVSFMEDIEPSVNWEEDWYDEGFPELEGTYFLDHFDQIWEYGAFATKFGDNIPREYVECESMNPYYMQLDPEFLRAKDIYEDIIGLAEVDTMEDW